MADPTSEIFLPRGEIDNPAATITRRTPKPPAVSAEIARCFVEEDVVLDIFFCTVGMIGDCVLGADVRAAKYRETDAVGDSPVLLPATPAGAKNTQVHGLCDPHHIPPQTLFGGCLFPKDPSPYLRHRNPPNLSKSIGFCAIKESR